MTKYEDHTPDYSDIRIKADQAYALLRMLDTTTFQPHPNRVWNKEIERVLVNYPAAYDLCGRFETIGKFIEILEGLAYDIYQMAIQAEREELATKSRKGHSS